MRTNRKYNDSHAPKHLLKRYSTFRQNPMFVCLFDLIFYIPSTVFQLNREGSSGVDPVLS